MLRLQVDVSGEAKALRDKAAGAHLYWYKSTKTDTNTKALRDKAAGAHLFHSLYLTCFTGTTVRALLVPTHKY